MRKLLALGLAGKVHVSDHFYVVATPIDLSLGYPHWRGPDWLETKLATGSPRARATDNAAERKRVIEAAARLLKLPPEIAKDGIVVPTGAIAFNRVTSMLRSGKVAIISPALGLFKDLLTERPDLSVESWHGISQLEKQRGLSSIVLASPNNPDGSVVSEDSLMRLLAFCAGTDTLLVVDQTFSTLDPNRINVPLVSSYKSMHAPWVMLWDTGKTFDLRGEKLGFAFASTGSAPALRFAADRLLGPEVSPRMPFISEVMETAHESGYLSWAADKIRTNIELIRDRCAESVVNPEFPQAGSTMLLHLEVPQHGFGGSRNFVSELRRVKNLNIRPGDDFRDDEEYYADLEALKADGNPRPASVRLPLARDSEVLDDAIGRIISLNEELIQSSDRAASMYASAPGLKT